MGLISKLLNFFAGPSDQAFVRHLEYERELVKRDPLSKFMNQRPPAVHTLREGEAFNLKPSNPYTAAPVGSKKKVILNFIKSHSPKGITAENVGKAFPAWRYSTVTARISELHKAGSIAAVGTANTSFGTQAALYAVSEAK